MSAPYFALCCDSCNFSVWLLAGLWTLVDFQSASLELGKKPEQTMSWDRFCARVFLMAGCVHARPYILRGGFTNAIFLFSSGPKCGSERPKPKLKSLCSRKNTHSRCSFNEQSMYQLFAFRIQMRFWRLNISDQPQQLSKLQIFSWRALVNVRNSRLLK